jgi:hypothetical protein
MAHGHVLRAFGAHLMGPPLFLITLAVALSAPWCVRRATSITNALSWRGSVWVLSVTLALGLMTFAERLWHKFS